jgi:hypothetical protein
MTVTSSNGVLLIPIGLIVEYLREEYHCTVDLLFD